MKMDATYYRRRGTFLSLFLFFITAANAQTGVLVTYYDGSQQTYNVTTAGKLYFSSDNLQIKQTEASTVVSIPVSIIRKINFTTAALPLKLTDFSLVNDKAQVLLSWKSESETNASHFVVERSTDGNSFLSIGQVAALNKATGGSYAFTDLSPTNGTTYYRLKLVDADGKYEYSKVLTVKRSAADVIITLWPNPAADFIQINSSNSDKLSVKIFSADGRLRLSGTYTSGEQIAIGQLTPGLYIANIKDKTYKLIKQ